MKKGPWSPEEDAKLKSYIETSGTGGNWIALPHKIGINSYSFLFIYLYKYLPYIYIISVLDHTKLYSKYVKE